MPDPRGLVAPGDSARTPPPSSTPTLPVLCSWFYCMPGCYSTACIVLLLMHCFFLYSYLFSEFPVSLELPLYKLLKVSVIHVQVNVLMLFIFIVISGIPLFIQVLTSTFSSFKYIYCETVYLLLMSIYLIPLYIYQNNSHLNKSVGNYACIVHLVG